MDQRASISKKVFLIYPSPSLERSLAAIADLDYEVYLVRDHEALRAILPHVGPSVLFVNLDSGPSLVVWASYLHALGCGELGGCRSMACGEEFVLRCLSSDPRLSSSLEDRPGAPRGLHTGSIFEAGMDGGKEAILADLEAMDARGRRRHVRAMGRNRVSCLLSVGSGSMEAEVRDFSASGLALVLGEGCGLSIGSAIGSLELRAQGFSVCAKGIVAAMRPDTDGKVVCIVMFVPASVEGQGKARLRAMVRSMNQADLEAMLKGSPSLALC